MAGTPCHTNRTTNTLSLEYEGEYDQQLAAYNMPHYPYYPAGAGGGLSEYDEGEFLKFLQESFPGYSLDGLQELLEANGEDANITVEMLLEICTVR